MSDIDDYIDSTVAHMDAMAKLYQLNREMDEKLKRDVGAKVIKRCDNCKQYFDYDSHWIDLCNYKHDQERDLQTWCDECFAAIKTRAAEPEVTR